MMRRHVDADVRAALPAITAPTLVVHYARDPVVPAALGRYVAERVGGARWIEIPDDIHSSWLAEDQDAIIDPIETFLSGTPCPTSSRASERVFATFLFTDVVASTAHVASIGDARWRTILDAHDAAVREELVHWRGRAVRHTGDGFFAVFDGPGRAVRCALEVVNRAHQLGIDVRCGLHAGESEVHGDDFVGLAVHAAARVVAAAAPGQVLVTGTVKDIVIGSGLLFEALGTRAFKGVPSDVSLYAAGALQPPESPERVSR
jgi:class 3 adenylate cyclase